MIWTAGKMIKCLKDHQPSENQQMLYSLCSCYQGDIILQIFDFSLAVEML